METFGGGLKLKEKGRKTLNEEEKKERKCYGGLEKGWRGLEEGEVEEKKGL